MHSSLAFSEFEYTLFCILIAPNHTTPVTSVRGIQGIKASIPDSWTWSLFYCLCLQVILQRSSAGPKGHAGHVLCVPVPCEPVGSWTRRWGLSPSHCDSAKCPRGTGGRWRRRHQRTQRLCGGLEGPWVRTSCCAELSRCFHPGHPAGPGLRRGAPPALLPLGRLSLNSF